MTVAASPRAPQARRDAPGFGECLSDGGAALEDGLVPVRRHRLRTATSRRPAASTSARRRSPSASRTTATEAICAMRIAPSSSRYFEVYVFEAQPITPGVRDRPDGRRRAPGRRDGRLRQGQRRARQLLVRPVGQTTAAAAPLSTPAEPRARGALTSVAVMTDDASAGISALLAENRTFPPSDQVKRTPWSPARSCTTRRPRTTRASGPARPASCSTGTPSGTPSASGTCRTPSGSSAASSTSPTTASTATSRRARATRWPSTSRASRATPGRSPTPSCSTRSSASPTPSRASASSAATASTSTCR